MGNINESYTRSLDSQSALSENRVTLSWRGRMMIYLIYGVSAVILGALILKGTMAYLHETFRWVR